MQKSKPFHKVLAGMHAKLAPVGATHRTTLRTLSLQGSLKAVAPFLSCNLNLAHVCLSTVSATRPLKNNHLSSGKAVVINQGCSTMGLLVRRTLQEVTAGNTKSPVVGNVFGLQECGRLCVWRRGRWLGGGVRVGRTTLRLWLCSEGHMELRTAFHKGQACFGPFSKDSSALWVENFHPSV